MADNVGGERIRVRGLVQGVGFRPTVWRLARECGLLGDVRNDGEGVLIRAWAPARAIEAFCQRLRAQCPPLARIDAIERGPLAGRPPPGEFRIVASESSTVRTGVVADAATCVACAAEIRAPANRRYRYPFTNCTHCGPRLSIVRAIPYDRANTSMDAFPMCPQCQREYGDPTDRRFHAQPNACPVCGPRVWLADVAGTPIDPVALGADDAVAAAARLLAEGRILAIKGVGGFHLACDACDRVAVDRLRQRKRRFAKPFALMARDLETIGRYVRLSDREAALLQAPAAPIVLLERVASAPGVAEIAPAVAPGQTLLGFMLPYSPLHHLLLAPWDRPLVMTSGNLSEEPQCIDNAHAVAELGGIADLLLLHDRGIVNRVDDSVVRVMDGSPRLLRRARGYAPEPLPLPPGFDEVPPVLALGGELKSTICLLGAGCAVLSQHLGDLEEARTAREFARTIDLYRALFQHRPSVLAVDAHPDYRSSQLGRDWAARDGMTLVEVQHHHAHIASVLGENGWPRDGGPVLGMALDGLGWGADGTLWGGELLVADYHTCTRVGHLRPVPMPGGVQAILEPWRNTYAQLATLLGWGAYWERYAGLDLSAFLAGKPLGVLATMIDRGINAPPSTSCGRLFDAVAAAVGLCRERLSYEGQAAIELEALAAGRTIAPDEGYPFAVTESAGCLVLDPTPMWVRLLDDLAQGVTPGTIAARFHAGLARALVALAERLAGCRGLGTVAVSGGVLQNRTLFEAIAGGLRQRGLGVLAQRLVPANDGGLALGQALIAATSYYHAVTRDR